MMHNTVVIVGGGVTGLSTAYHLALRNFGRIIVIDKGPIGDGSSSRAAAIITGLLWSETGVRARKIALQRFHELSHELPGYRFYNVGCLNWFDAASWKERESLLPLYDRCGAPYEVMNAAEMQRRWPALQPVNDFIGLFDPLGGYSEPDAYLPALANKCRELGVEVLERTQVTEILTAGDRIRGVQTDCGTYESDAVIIASYAWANQILKSVDINLPVKSFVHQRYITRPLPDKVEMPAVNANPLGGYVRPALGKRLLIGVETADRPECKIDSLKFNMNELTADSAPPNAMIENFSRTIPSLNQTQWESYRVGLIMYSADNEPILGEFSAYQGLFIGAAFHSGGFAYNPASGLLLAQLVAEGKTEIDISTFSPNRFNFLKTKEYLNKTATLGDAERRRH